MLKTNYALYIPLFDSTVSSWKRTTRRANTATANGKHKSLYCSCNCNCNCSSYCSIFYVIIFNFGPTLKWQLSRRPFPLSVRSCPGPAQGLPLSYLLLNRPNASQKCCCMTYFEASPTLNDLRSANKPKKNREETRAGDKIL